MLYTTKVQNLNFLLSKIVVKHYRDINSSKHRLIPLRPPLEKGERLLLPLAKGRWGGILSEFHLVAAMPYAIFR